MTLAVMALSIVSLIVALILPTPHRIAHVLMSVTSLALGALFLIRPPQSTSKRDQSPRRTLTHEAENLDRLPKSNAAARARGLTTLPTKRGYNAE
jgi:hypothetical protein